MSEEIEEKCRTCLAQTPGMISLAADHVVCFMVMSVLDLLKTCTSAQIELNDEYPQFVCLLCIRKVEKAFEFRKQCEEVDKTLRTEESKTNEDLDEHKETELKLEDVNNDDASDTYEEYEVLDDSIEDIESITEETDDCDDPKEVYIEESDDPKEVYIEQIDDHVEVSNVDIAGLSFQVLQNDTDDIKCEDIEIIEAFSCSICDLIFPTEVALQKHSNSLHPPNFYKCSQCPVRFISEELLKRHVTKHTSAHKEDKKPARKYIKQKKKPIDNMCTWCGKKFASMPALKLHSRKHFQPGETNSVPVQTLVCEECGEQCSTEDDLKTHVDRMHLKIKNIKNQCTVCYKTFLSAESLQKHETIHDARIKVEHEPTLHKMVYKCKTCSHEVKVLTEIKDHLVLTHKVDTKNIFKHLLYNCSECQKDFVSIYEYFDHTNQRNCSILSTNGSTLMRKKPYVCTVANCGKAFPSPSALKNHSRSHETHWPKKCKYCDTIVTKLHEYIRHLNENHEQLKKFACKTCGKKFFSERNLKTHSGIHSGERNYMCDYCGFSFHAHNNLVSHRRIHEGIKPYKCTYCPTAFSQYAGLRSHLLNHTQEKKYECPTCNRKFLRHSAMKNHIKTHTGQKDYMCHVCGARFGASSSRKKHLLTHTGERNHVCDFCGKAFGRKSNLTVHRKIHTGETPHVCEICGKGFIQKHVLRSHMDTHKKPGMYSVSKKNFNKKRHYILQKLEDDKSSESEELTVLVEFPE